MDGSPPASGSAPLPVQAVLAASKGGSRGRRPRAEGGGEPERFPPSPQGTGISRGTALKFVLLLGVVSLFADMTYEGARSITGPYLAVLGAGATVVGIVAGFGELVGYGLRLVSGYVSDRTGKYWWVTLVGYGVNLVAVPLLAVAGRWELAALLMIAERAGKAIRTPSRDAMLSHATATMGYGWGFGLHEALDQTGALIGPLVVAAVIALRGGYENGFAVLAIPAVLALAVLLTARMLYPDPRNLETIVPDLEARGLPRGFWIYLAAAALVAAGFADFPLVAFHFQKASVIRAEAIPIYYAVAMASAAIASLVFGRLFDRVGMAILIVATLPALLFAPLVFLGGAGAALLGVALWGIGVGTHESIMRAAVAPMVVVDRRATAYGIFNTGYGLFWFLGSVALGVLYDRSLPSLVAVSVLVQALSVPVLCMAMRSYPPHRAAAG
jgi:predicted MFS family arabinose efflux permease